MSNNHNPLTQIPIRAARWSATHPWRAMLAWLVFVLVAVGLAVAVPTTETKDSDYRMGESGHADALEHQAGLDQPQTENVLINPRGHAALDSVAATSAATEIRDGMRDVAGVVNVSQAQPNADRSALLISVQLARDQDDVSALQAVTKRVQADHPDLQVREAGDVSIDASINDRVGSDLSSAEGISLPVTLILMLLAFGALIAAGIPVLLAATSVAATIGITAPLSHLVHAEATVSSMIVLIGMAVGVDYSLFYLKREREERAAGRSTLDAVEIAAQTSGHSILVSGGAVIASMAGLFVIGDATFNSLATGAILVVAIAVLGSITVLPALLVKLGRWVDRPRVPLLWRLNRRIGRGGISSRLLSPVLRHPAVALVALRCGRAAARSAGARDEDPRGQPADAARLDPRGADLHADHPGVPGRGDHRHAWWSRHRPRTGSRWARRCGELDREAISSDGLRRLGSGPRAGLGGRHHVGARRSRCRTTSRTRRSTERSPRCVPTSSRRHSATSTSSTPSAVARPSRWTTSTGSTTGCRS